MSNYVQQDVPVGAFMTEAAAYAGQVQRLLLLDPFGDDRDEAGAVGNEHDAAVIAAHVSAARAEAVVHALRIQSFCRAYPEWVNSQISSALATDDSDPATREVLKSIFGNDESAHADRMIAAIDRIAHPAVDHSAYCESLLVDIEMMFIVCHLPGGAYACIMMASLMGLYAANCMLSA